MKLLGGVMMGCGILIALVSGLCTLILLSEYLQTPGGVSMLMTLGGAPLVVGIAMILAGRVIIRKHTPPPPPDKDVFY